MGNGIIRYLVESVFSVLYASGDKCLVCGDFEENNELICNKCRAGIMYCQSKFTLCRNNVEIHCYCAAYYTSTIRELIRRLKYKSDFMSGEFLAQLLIETVNLHNIEFDLITFVPMTSRALKKRGYNQSRLLADLVAKHFNKPVREILVKKTETKDQIGLDGENRWMNLSDCFVATKEYLFKNKKIILIDDVLTTGATAFLCSEQLLLNGALEVTILTAAKSQL